MPTAEPVKNLVFVNETQERRMEKIEVENSIKFTLTRDLEI
jgi:hypothetical protein